MKWKELGKLFGRPRTLVRAGLGMGGLVFVVGAMVGGLVLRAPKPVAINLATDPADAEVMIDGQAIGSTPLTTAVREGEHTVTISKPGFLTVERKIFADRSAPRASNDISFGLEPNIATSVPNQRSAMVAKLKLQAQEAYRRGDLVAPEKDNALYYVDQLAIISPNEQFIAEMRYRIRHALKQRAEASKPRNDLA